MAIFLRKKDTNFQILLHPFVHNKKWTWRKKLNQARFCVTYFKLSLNCIYLEENRYAWYFTFVSQLVSMQICWNDNIYYFAMPIYFVFVFRKGFNVDKTILFIKKGSFSWYLHMFSLSSWFCKPKTPIVSLRSIFDNERSGQKHKTFVVKNTVFCNNQKGGIIKKFFEVPKMHQIFYMLVIKFKA